MAQLRDAGLQDLPGAYAVCLATGRSGQDASSLYRNGDLIGHLHTGPYFAAPGAIALVVADRHGVAGYCLAAPETRAHEQWCAAHWWPALRRQYPLGDGDVHRPDHELVRQLHAAEAAPADLLDAYPAHLHVDLLLRTQGRGWGRRLVEQMGQRLARAGASGVHLGVAADNTRAQDFYRHLGFTELRRSARAVVYGRRLP